MTITAYARVRPRPHQLQTPAHLARAAAWRRAGAKLRRLAARRPFVADLVVVGTERAIDRLLADESPAPGAAADGGGLS